jgi:hypothetical protein
LLSGIVALSCSAMVMAQARWRRSPLDKMPAAVGTNPRRSSSTGLSVPIQSPRRRVCRPTP